MTSQTPADDDLVPLWNYIESQFSLGLHSLHGPAHWRRVERNGLEIASLTPQVDASVVRLFAVLHDSRRIDEGTDFGHGQRGAELAQQLRGRLFEIDDEGFSKLYDACASHEKGRLSAEPTIGACWDADRLDLTRIGARPLAKFMSTSAGKAITVQRNARQ